MPSLIVASVVMFMLAAAMNFPWWAYIILSFAVVVELFVGAAIAVAMASAVADGAVYRVIASASNILQRGDDNKGD